MLRYVDFYVRVSSFHFLGHVFGNEHVRMSDAGIMVVVCAGYSPGVVKMLVRLLADASITCCCILGVAFERHKGHERARQDITTELIHIEQNFILGVPIIDGNGTVSFRLAALVLPNGGMS